MQNKEKPKLLDAIIGIYYKMNEPKFMDQLLLTEYQTSKSECMYNLLTHILPEEMIANLPGMAKDEVLRDIC